MVLKQFMPILMVFMQSIQRNDLSNYFFSINNASPKRPNFLRRGLNSRFIESICSVQPLLNVFLSTITLTNNTSNQLPDPDQIPAQKLHMFYHNLHDF